MSSLIQRALSHPTWVGIGSLAAVVALVVTLAVALGAFGSDETAPTPAKPTTDHFVTPFGVQLRYTEAGYEPVGDFSFTREVTGRCGPVSLVDYNNPQAYGCVVVPGPGRRDWIFYDPCFSARDVAKNVRLYCWAAPWLDVMTPLIAEGKPGGERPTPAERAQQHSPPWSLRLSNGYYCVVASGRPALPIGRPLTYACFDGPQDWTRRNRQWRTLEADAWIVGEIDRSSPTWQASFLSNASTELVTVPILDAWT